MLMVDSSVWVDYFNDAPSPAVGWLHEQFARQDILIGDLILTEVLQGFRQEKSFRKALATLKLFPIVPMLGEAMAVQAARRYRALREKGVTVRKTIDVLIGSYCIEHALPLLYTDRDFEPMVKHLGLLPAFAAH